MSRVKSNGLTTKGTNFKERPFVPSYSNASPTVSKTHWGHIFSKLAFLGQESEYSQALRCTFFLEWNGKTCVAQNSCILSYLIRQRQEHQKTAHPKFFGPTVCHPVAEVHHILMHCRIILQ